MDSDETKYAGEQAEGTAANGEVLSDGDDKAAEYLDLLQRERAAFVNFRRRTEQERTEWQQYAATQFMKKFLPVVDDFDRAIAATPADNAWVTGFKLIERKMKAMLDQEGVTRIESLGQPFDPTLHEAVAYEDGQGEDVVVEEFQPGYRMRDRVLRPAMVKVGKRPVGAAAQQS